MPSPAFSMARRTCLAALAAALAASASAIEVLDLNRARTAAPIAKGETGGKVYPVHQDKSLRVALFVLPAGSRRPFLKTLSDYTLSIALRRQSYRSNKLVSTGQGFKKMLVDRGDYFLHFNGQVSGGWYVGKESDFEMLEIVYPPRRSEVLPWEQGRKVITDLQPSVFGTMSDARAAVDFATGTLRVVPLVSNTGLRLEMIRLSASGEIRNETSRSAALFPIDGTAFVSTGTYSARLDGTSVVVLSPGEGIRLSVSGDWPFYALFSSYPPAPHGARSPGPPAALAQTPWGMSAPAAGAPVGPVERSTGAAGVKISKGKAGIEWIEIEGGSFVMGTETGDEQPAHPVRVRTFEISRTPVTVKQYRFCVEAGVCAAPDLEGCGSAPSVHDDQPVVCVNWSQAQTFAAWAGGRLPTEAEWEFAARSRGKGWKHPWGNGPATCELAVYRDAGAGACGRETPWPVCAKPGGATEQGLCDMAGNVLQWVQDWYQPSYEGAPADGSWQKTPNAAWASKVQRGGCWIFGSNWIRTTARTGDLPTQRGDYIGFRVARSSN